MKKISDYDDVIEEERRREEKYDSAAEYLEQTERIKKEERRLRRLFSKIDKSKKNLVQATISDVAFMTVTMENLREKIIREGTTATYKNGENQYGTKQSPDAQLYLQMSQKQTAAMKILVDCLPKTEKLVVQQDDGFEDFLKGRGA